MRLSKKSPSETAIWWWILASSVQFFTFLVLFQLTSIRVSSASITAFAETLPSATLLVEVGFLILFIKSLIKVDQDKFGNIGPAYIIVTAILRIFLLLAALGYAVIGAGLLDILIFAFMIGSFVLFGQICLLMKHTNPISHQSRILIITIYTQYAAAFAAASLFLQDFLRMFSAFESIQYETFLLNVPVLTFLTIVPKLFGPFVNMWIGVYLLTRMNLFAEYEKSLTENGNLLYPKPEQPQGKLDYDSRMEYAEGI
ncbi:MAG: hypothetical protein IH840_00940 [Candidatus Heimdallarchaeota archaeon]|nr:hypothetical protein [Candidatus Heimdallarchaeota archaeon]